MGAGRRSKPSSDAIRARVKVTGLVQGVWFRDECRTEARALGVRGYVRNCTDGSVEAEFEGPAPAVERMIAWCRSGSARARVDGTEVERIPTVGEPAFRIR